MNAHLLDKYNTPVPRYTSYPPANYFTDKFTQTDFREAVVASNQARDNHISFYLHIPFCQRLCHYCGCNAYAMRKPHEVEEYIKSLHTEIDLIKALLEPGRKIAQIHYGGGSPTALPGKYLKELNRHLLEGFETIHSPEIAIECHPGYLNQGYWEDLLEAGFNRFSIGVQDFNPEVLHVANRKASLLPLADIFQILRKQLGVSINLDFIYGLPRQSITSFSDSIQQAISLQPDRLVTFSYAHVPWVNKQQLRLEKAGLPTNEEKSGMYGAAHQLLTAAGYQAIGLDHFVKEEDELYVALQNGQLHRNFQGYCTRRTTGQVYAFGVTGISQLNAAYAQNTKSIEEYTQLLNIKNLPIIRGYTLSANEQVCREVIETLMCNFTIDWEELSYRLALPIETIKQKLVYDEAVLQELQNDGIIHYTSNSLQVTPVGRIFVRRVAAALDPLMLHSTKSFSKPV